MNHCNGWRRCAGGSGCVFTEGFIPHHCGVHPPKRAIWLLDRYTFFHSNPANGCASIFVQHYFIMWAEEGGWKKMMEVQNAC